MDQKEQIVRWVSEIDDLKSQVAGHWSMVRKAVADHRLDDAISLLNAYFNLMGKLERVEPSLKSMLSGSFSDR